MPVFFQHDGTRVKRKAGTQIPSKLKALAARTGTLKVLSRVPSKLKVQRRHRKLASNVLEPLLASENFVSIPLPGGELWYQHDWLPRAEADALFASLRADVKWKRQKIKLFGKEHVQPRLLAWYGDPDARYRYSGVQYDPLPWSPSLIRLRERLQESLGYAFNSALANLYRDGRDSMGWHSDNEKELGAEPVIASVSLGAVRKFRLKERKKVGPRKITLEPAPGSLLVMMGTTQALWRHAVPRTRKPVGERINITFRRIIGQE